MEVVKHRFTDFFDLLEVDRTASKDTIQKAFMLKASVWHPDKAENDKDREYFTKIYQDLQLAYKILSNESSRKQYLDSQQTTNLEFKFAQRDVGYQQTDQFRGDNGRFDEQAFHNAFEQTLDQKETLIKLQQTQYGQTSYVNDNDLTSLLEQREADLVRIKENTAQIFTGTGDEFDSDTFNRAFDFMKKTNPGNGVQLYEGTPQGMFSGGGLAECDPMSGITFTNGTDFTAQGMDKLILGQSNNPTKNFDLTSLMTGEQYGKQQKLTNDEILSRMAEISADRASLATMDKKQFIVEPSEIEKLYSGLFIPMEMEGLEAPVGTTPVNHVPPVSTPTPSPSQTPSQTPSQSIRKKIEQNKSGSKIEKKRGNGRL